VVGYPAHPPNGVVKLPKSRANVNSHDLDVEEIVERCAVAVG
jgi:hypothetical protein